MVESDLEVLQPLLKSAQTAKNDFSERFSSIFQIWPYFGSDDKFLHQNYEFDKKLDLTIGTRENLGHFGKINASKMDLFSKITKKTPFFDPFFDHEILSNIENSSFQGHSGPLMAFCHESKFTQDH